MNVPLLERLAQGPLLADGAMGTMLHGRGIALDTAFDELVLTQPAVVADVHRAYIDAGAELILANTFGANRYKLALHGLADRVAEVNTAAVTLARRVVDASFKPVYVAGDVGPLGVRLAPYGRVSELQAYEAFYEQITALVAAGIDALVCETMSDLYEIRAAIRAGRNASAQHGGPHLPIVATLTFTRDDRTLLGDTPATAADSLIAAGADVIGVNCSGGPAQILRVITAMRQAVPNARFAVKPNAGWPEQVEGRIMYPATPTYFGDYAARFAALGVNVMGGCCGTTPAHIAAMRVALDDPGRIQAAATQIVVLPSAPEVAAAETTPDGPPSVLARRLADPESFVVTVEMDPPRGADTHKMLAGARLLQAAGADAIDVADQPMARMRMSAWAVAHVIEREIGLETVLHFPTRGRNLLRVQGDLLAAHALGLRNLFATLGDPTAIGDYPNANDAYDVVPSGLIKLVKRGFNVGVDHAGVKIGAPTRFFVGCALNLCAPDIDKEIKTLRKKIEAGADFALTQPIYTLEPARAFLERYAELHGPLMLPVLVGVLPLYNVRHATFLNNEVPGIRIPEATMQRMASAGEAGSAEGVQLALELLAELRGLPVVRGAYLMPPFGRYEMAAEILEGVRSVTV
ncbi:MAG TPA: bifunctional homocysteine S-methyltransferase/methylenetetrahydrofolate reductase [Anaerolineales bacterium]|nr:bifunctional homocysteine S-methyltransferase/methylenetetrahydrofolate reductase [Anaerolineales bacterium]HRF46483.1 bifunctional homocysteine S-methyltransferase/methylenetetrahydrofolate reductase [Anaerolineales bacterium]